MKHFSTQWLGVLALLLVGSLLSLHAQENRSDEVIIIQKKENDDGTYTVTKKRVTEALHLEKAMKQLHEANHHANVEYKIITEHAGKLKEELALISTEMDDLHKVTADHQVISVVGSHVDGPPILGVYVDEGADVQGIRLSGVVAGKGSETAGLKGGDVVTSIDGQAINSVQDLRSVLAGHKAGDQVKVVYSREGQVIETAVALSERNYGYSFSRERDPCKPFIGVYLSGNGPSGNGVNILRTIEGTPAREVKIQDGDVLMALDGVPVNTYSEVRIERDKHEAGDFFTLTILRDGEEFHVEAQFPPCDEEIAGEPVLEEPIEEFVEEEIEEPVEQAVPETPAITFDNGLQLEELSAYPNPTFGRLKVEFKAEAVPTFIRIMDVNGKTVYSENLRNFDGYYNKELNFTDVTPGALLLNIRQGDKVFTEKVILLDRA